MVVAVLTADAHVGGGGCCPLRINKCAVGMAHSAVLAASHACCPDALLMFSLL